MNISHNDFFTINLEFNNFKEFVKYRDFIYNNYKKPNNIFNKCGMNILGLEYNCGGKDANIKIEFLLDKPNKMPAIKNIEDLRKLINISNL